MSVRTSRRGFLQTAAATGAALYIGFKPSGGLATSTDVTALNPFVKISEDSVVTVIVKHFEMGQGTSTGLAALVAEELDADWDKVEVEFAPADPKRYANLLFGMQGTGGSTAMANSFMQYRKAGAAAREVILRAAAAAWNVPVEEISLEFSTLKHGNVFQHPMARKEVNLLHTKGKVKRTRIGEFVAAAAKLTPSEEPKLKDPAKFSLIGKQKLHRKDNYSKTNGQARFALDVKVPGMVTAMVLRSPKFGGKLASYDATAAKAVAGFVDVKALPDNRGVVVYAKNTWSAIKARQSVKATWDYSNAEQRNTEQMVAEHFSLLEVPTYQAGKDGDPKRTDGLIAKSAQVIEADFLLPFLAHAPMEPLNCVIEPTSAGVRVHDGCQFPSLSHPTVAQILNLEPEQVEFNTVFAGGSFGRRATPDSDYQTEAAHAFALFGAKTPIKLVWTREDDIRGGAYRPMAAHRVRIGINAAGEISGWSHNIATRSIMKGTGFESFVVHDGVDHSSVEGIADTPYAIAGMSVGLADFESPVTVLWWRSVGHSHSAYVMEVAVDMAAKVAGKDPLEFRLALLAGGGEDQRRLRGVLQLAADKADWGKALPNGRGRGIALHKSFNSYVAQVAEVSTDAAGAIKIEKVTCAVDCGIAVNPDVVRAQMQGGIGYGIGAVMRNQITFNEGEVIESNFPDYAPLRMSDMPNVEVHIVASSEPPTGVGEPGTPPAGPALANAIFAATGKRITMLPMTSNGIEFA